MNRLAAIALSLVLLTGVIDVNISVSQDQSRLTSHSTFPSSLLFVEAGGHGLASINYEYYFSNRVGLRVGYGLYIPMLVNLYFGRNYLFELGAGLIFTQYNILESFQGKQRTLLLGFTVGHKFQPLEGGVSLRYSFTPMFNPSNKKFQPMVGLSLGFAFR